MKRRVKVVTALEPEVLDKCDKLRGETSLWAFLERAIVEGVAKLEQARGALEGSTGQGSEIVSGEDRERRERDWREVFRVRPEERKKGK